MKTTGTLLIAACLMFAAAVPSLAGDAPAALAKLYGINGWDQIEELRYTFNVRSGGHEVRRSWVWRVIDRKVTFRDELSGEEPVSYSLDDINEKTGDDLKKVDHRFINDALGVPPGGPARTLAGYHVGRSPAGRSDCCSDPIPVRGRRI